MLDAPEREIPEADLHAFEHHWQDEADAAYLYRILADAEPDQKKKDIYSRLAEVEDRHVVVWSELMKIHGHAPRDFQPSGRAKLLARVGKLFGPGFLLPMLLQEEGREVKAYLDMHRATPAGAPGGGEALTLAKESAEHATTLAGIAGKKGEPWHRTESGGFLRNVVYGFNDGLTANFGLVQRSVFWQSLEGVNFFHLTYANKWILEDKLDQNPPRAARVYALVTNVLPRHRDRSGGVPRLGWDSLSDRP